MPYDASPKPNSNLDPLISVEAGEKQLLLVVRSLYRFSPASFLLYKEAVTGKCSLKRYFNTFLGDSLNLHVLGNFIKSRLFYRGFLMNFEKFFRTTFW